MTKCHFYANLLYGKSHNAPLPHRPFGQGVTMSSVRCLRAPKKRQPRWHKFKEKLSFAVGISIGVFVLICIFGIIREVIHHL